jgi:hypothetical protein
MKKLHTTLMASLFIIGISGFTTNLFAMEPGEVQSLRSVSHVVNIPSQNSIIQMSWSPPDNSTDVRGYYTLFNSSQYYSFDEENTLSIQPIDSLETVSVDYGDIDDINVYFHIAATSSEDNIGETSTFGPIRIDTIAPTNPVLKTSDYATSQIVTLILGANNAIEMYISNTAHGVGGQWEPLVSPKIWELTEGQGLKTIYVQFRDRADNRTKAITSLNLDTIPPSVSISSDTPSVTNRSTITINLLFSESVTDLTQSDIFLNNCEINSLTGSDEHYQLIIMPAGSGEVSVQIPENKAFDVATNGNESSEILSFTYDPNPPQVSLTSETPQYTTQPLVEVTIKFSEIVNGFTQQDIQTHNVSEISSFSGSGNEYMLQLVPENQGSVEISIPENMATDNAGNGNVVSEPLIRNYDSIAPSVSITSTTRETTNISPIPITIVFDEMIKGFEASDIVTYGTINNFFALNVQENYASIFTFNLIPPGQGEISVQIAENAAVDHAGNGNSASQPFMRNYDLTQPDVVIVSTAPSVTNQVTINCSINFTTDVIDVDIQDIILTNAVFLGEVTGSGKIYAFQISPLTEGDVSVYIPDDTIFSTSGNTNRSSNTLTFSYDITPPLFSIQTVANNASSQTPIPVTLIFNESITGLEQNDFITQGISDLINFTTTEKQATFSVIPDSQGILTISVQSGIFTDMAGNPNVQSEIISLEYDIVQPSVSIESLAGTQVSDAPIPLSIVFSEPVEDFTLSDLSISNGQGSNLQKLHGDATFFSAYLLNIVPSDQGEIIISIPAGVAVDKAGNSNTNSDSYQINYANERPTVSLSSSTPLITDTSPILLDIMFSETMTNFDASDIVVSNGTVDQFSGSDDFYSCYIIPMDQGIVTVDIPESVAINQGGLNNIEAAQLIRTYDYNDTPIAYNATLSINEDSSVQYFLKASDLDTDDQLTFSIVNQITENYELNPITGELTYSPDENFNGQRIFQFNVNDGTEDSNVASLTITVLPMNDPPYLSRPLESRTILEDDYFEYYLPDSFIDIDVNDTLSYIALQTTGAALPSWLTFDPMGPSFTGTPTNSDIGYYTIKVKATDTSNISVSDSFSLTVLNVNDLPVLTTETTLEMYENKTSQSIVSVSDPDADSLLLKATSENDSLIPNTSITFSGIGITLNDDFSYALTPGPSGFYDLTMTIIPLANQSGVTPIILWLSDESTTISTTVSVDVQAVRYTISGRVDYFKDTYPVSNVDIVLNGTISDQTTTDENGRYTFSNIPTGDYSIEASRAPDNMDESISPMDASIIARSIVGLETLDCHQLIAADVTMNGDTSSMDTSKVARYSAGLITDLNNSNLNWTFINEPISDCSSWIAPLNDYNIEYDSVKTITDLTSNQLDINFMAIRLGDVTGNWPDNHMRKRISKRNVFSPIVISRIAGETFQVMVTLNSYDTSIYGIEIMIQYDAEKVQLLSAQKDQTIFDNSDYELVNDGNFDGSDIFEYHTSSDLITESGHVLLLTFQALENIGETAIKLKKFIINEDKGNAEGGFNYNSKVGYHTINSKFSYDINLLIHPMSSGSDQIGIVDAVKAIQDISKGNQNFDLKQLIQLLKIFAGF